MPVQIDKLVAERFVKEKSKGSQVVLDVDGQKLHVLIKEIDYNPLKKQIDEIDFQVLVKGEKVHSVAEVVLLHHDKVADGVIEQKLEEISYKATPEALVEKVEIDLGKLRAGDSVQVKDLDIASKEGIDLITDPETTVVTISEVYRGAEEAEETAEEK